MDRVRIEEVRIRDFKKCISKRVDIPWTHKEPRACTLWVTCGMECEM